MKKPVLKIGDTVKYKREWLQSTGNYTGDLPFARGTIEAITKSHIATINWGHLGNDEFPRKIHINNLTLVSDPELC